MTRLKPKGAKPGVKIATGIIREATRFRVYVKVGKAQPETSFILDTPLGKMKQWRADTRYELKKAAGKTAPTGTLGDAIEHYLAQVKAMPTYAQREIHLGLWREALGASSQRAAITAARIRTVLQTWRQQHAAATCNKRRSALMHLWSVLDGKGASNPVRDVPKFRIEDPLPRGRDPHAIDAALLKASPCRARACCRVLLWTGMRPSELQLAEPGDVSTVQKMAIVRTAKGGRTRVVPLTSQAVAAWKEFEHWDCWGKIPQAAPMNRWLKEKTGMEDLRVYDLRHSYGTALARRQTRLDVIGALMGHSTLELTRRYTLASVTPDALSATGKLARRTAKPRSKAGKKLGPSSKQDVLRRKTA